MQKVAIQLLYKSVIWTALQPFFKLFLVGRRKHFEIPTYSVLLKTETGNSNNVMGGTDNKP